MRTLTETDRGVSPVIGVILMVAITVILAAVIGTFVLELGGAVSESVQAGANVDTDASANTITVTYTQSQNANSLSVEVTNSTGRSVHSDTLGSVGESTTALLSDGTFRVVVTATNDNSDTVIISKDVDL